MIFGISASTYALIHVVISLIGIASGFVVLFGMFNAKRLDRWTAVFLVTTAAMSLTGFGFPFDHLLPAHKVGMLSFLVLVVAALARYGFHLRGAGAGFMSSPPSSRFTSTCLSWSCKPSKRFPR